MLVATDGHRRVRAMDWAEHEARLRGLMDRNYGQRAVTLREEYLHGPLFGRLKAYFAGDAYALASITTRTEGTLFQELVWRAIRKIPVGETRSYSQVAEKSHSALPGISRYTESVPVKPTDNRYKTS